MGVIQFMDDFRVLHTRARKGQLSEEERPLYLSAREQFARALVDAQGMTLEPGQSARRTFRVAEELAVELWLEGKPLKVTTLDVSCGGFSAMLPRALEPEQVVAVSLHLPGEARPVSVNARVASVRPRGEQRRVSFAFQELPETESERLESVLLDVALERIGLVG
jgi:hypothetical protein